MISGTRFNLTAEINRQAKLGRDVARIQTEISTGTKILAPSDDPGAAARVSMIARAQTNELSWTNNVETATALTGGADTALSAVAAAVYRAGELMVAAASDGLSEGNRATIALELRGIAEEIGRAAELKDSRGRLLFPTDEPLALPVGDGVAVKPVPGRAAIFDAVQTSGGPATLTKIMEDAAAAISLADPAARRTATQKSLGEIGAADNHVASMRSDLGVRGQRIDQARERLAASKLGLAEERSGLEDTDVAEAVARLQAKKLSLEAAQSVFARINRNTLFDLIR